MYLATITSTSAISLSHTQAEKRATIAAARLDELLHRTTKNWLPLWMEEHYNKARSSSRRFLHICTMRSIFCSTVHRVNLLAADLYIIPRMQGYRAWCLFQAPITKLASGSWLNNICAASPQGYEAVRPHAETAWKHASTAHKTAYAKGVEWYEMGSKKGQNWWKDAGPMLHKTHASLKVRPSLNFIS